MSKLRTALIVILVAGWTLQAGAQGTPEHSVARIWNEQLMDAIRTDIPKPPVHARNLFHLSVVMWDAWAHYDPIAQGYLYTEKSTLLAPASTVPVEAEGRSHRTFGTNARLVRDEGPGTPATNLAKVYDPVVEAARAEAISFAAYRLLRYRFPIAACHPGAAAALAAFDAQMDALGYDKTFTSTDGDSPAAVGNRIASIVIAHGQTDGSNEGPTLCYPDDTGYTASNPNLIFKLPGNPSMVDPNHWQQLAFDFLVLQNGIIVGAAVQSFVGVGWGDVVPFGLTAADVPAPDPSMPCWTVAGVPAPYFDPGCPPQLGGVGDETLKQAILENIRFSGWTDPAQSPLIDISPGSLGNNSLGADDGSGHPVNPVTGLPYAANMVNRADWVRVVAQSWSDGPHSETPPGHWNVLANEVVADNPDFVRRIAGVDPIVNALEWDVKVYIALNGAAHDAAISAWSTKNYYDSSRPISLVRYMAGLGQSSDPGQLSYHPDGLLLEPDLVEVITAESVEPGGKFESLKSFCAGGGPATNVGEPCNTDDDCPDDGPYDGFCESSIGKIAIYAWLGPPADAANTTAGVGWRLAETWMPWFPATFVTPPFPGYTSGHSAFSRAAAEVLAAITGSPYFPGGLGTFDTVANEYIGVEDGPTANLQLQWATYFDASDEAGISRRFGGIHPSYDDFPSRIMGSKVGQRAYATALALYGCGDGTVLPPEQCDDGNTEDGDGCSSTCTFEAPPCDDASVLPPVCDGACPGPDVCTFAPSLQRCACRPLLVTLESFTAQVERDGVRLRWKTTFEMDNVGFQILLERPHEAPVAISPLIVAQGNELTGAEYEYLDTSHKRRGKVYTYYLQDLDTHGVASIQGDPVEVVIQGKARPVVPETSRSTGR